MFKDIIKFFLKHRILSIIGWILIIDAFRKAIQLFYLIINKKTKK